MRINAFFFDNQRKIPSQKCKTDCDIQNARLIVYRSHFIAKPSNFHKSVPPLVIFDQTALDKPLKPIHDLQVDAKSNMRQWKSR